MANQVTLAHPAPLELPVSKVTLVQQDYLALLVNQATSEPRDLLVHWANLVRGASRALLGRLEPRDPPEHLVESDQMETRALQEKRVLRALLDHKELLDHKAQQGS